MVRREDPKSKEQKKPKELPLSAEQKKEAMRRDIREAFRRAFSYEDDAVVPNQRSK